VTVSGSVTALLPDEVGSSGVHERFIVQLQPGFTVLVVDNVSIATRAPVSVGEPVTVHGEYVWNAEGGLIHFTHHDPQGTHEGGWIKAGGQTYQ
jgi:hypothetical protein